MVGRPADLAERQQLVTSELEHRTRNRFGLIEIPALRLLNGAVRSAADQFLGRL